MFHLPVAYCIFCRLPVWRRSTPGHAARTTYTRLSKVTIQKANVVLLTRSFRKHAVKLNSAKRIIKLEKLAAETVVQRDDHDVLALRKLVADASQPLQLDLMNTQTNETRMITAGTMTDIAKALLHTI